MPLGRIFPATPTDMSLKLRVTDDMKAAMRAKETAPSVRFACYWLRSSRKKSTIASNWTTLQSVASSKNSSSSARIRSSSFRLPAGTTWRRRNRPSWPCCKAICPNSSPPPRSAAVAAAIAESGASSAKDMGKVMGLLKTRLAGRADMGQVSSLIKAAPGLEYGDATAIDRTGVKVGVSRGGGSDQFLTRALKFAQVVRVPGGVPNAVEALRSGTADVWAANPVTLREIEDALPGARAVPGAWNTGRYAASLPKGRSAAARNKLAQIIDEARRSGVVRRAIDCEGFKGVRVAPG